MQRVMVLCGWSSTGLRLGGRPARRAQQTNRELGAGVSTHRVRGLLAGFADKETEAGCSRSRGMRGPGP